MVQHLKDYANEAVKISGIQHDGFVFEFGSNDGTLLRHFKNLGFKVLGMDPAKNLADIATASGLPTITDFLVPTVQGRYAPATVQHNSSARITVALTLMTFMASSRELKNYWPQPACGSLKLVIFLTFTETRCLTLFIMST